MKLQLLSESPYLRISLDVDRNLIHADWIGYQTVSSVQDGCERILELMAARSASHVLNDNTNVQGIWSGAALWVARDWFPRMRQAGMGRFAWVYSPARFSRISTDMTLAELGEAAPYIKVFDDIELALAWLDETDARLPALQEWTRRADAAGTPKAVIAAVVAQNWNPVRAWREHLGLPQATVAARLGLSQIEYAAREAISSSPPENDLATLASLFGVPRDLLVVGSG